jgi:hypothetical protein
VPIANSTVGVEVRASMTGGQQVTTGLTQIETGLNKLGSRAQQSLNSIGTKMQGALTETIGQLKSLPATLMSSVVGGFVGGLTSELVQMPQKVGAAVMEAAQKSSQLTLTMDRLAQSTGLSLQQVSALSYATERYKLSQDVLNGSMSAFSRYLVATKGSAANIQQELAAAADQFQRMPPGIERNTLAMKMFGDAGLKLLPILAQGSQGLDQFAQAADRAGRLVDERAVAAARRFEEAQARFQDAQNRTNVVIGNMAIPLLTQLYENSNRATDGGNRLSQAFDMVGRAFGEVTSKGSLSNETFIKLGGSFDLVLASVLGLNPALSGISNNFEVAGQAALGAGNNAVVAAGQFVQATQIISLAQFEARMADLDRSKANAAYSQMRFNMAQREGIPLLRQSELNMLGLNLKTGQWRQRMDQLGNSTAKTAGALYSMAGGGGAAASALERVSDAQGELNKRTQQMQGLMGASLEPMNKMQKLQAAYALATGQTTLAQEQMKIAVQGVMKGFDAGSITMADALGLVLALRNGQVDYARALQAAGPAAQPYINDLNEFTAAATEGVAKTLQLSQGVDNLPGKAEVKVDATVTGMPAVDDLHDRVRSLPSEKTVTIKAMVIGLDQLAGDFYNYAPRTGSQPVIPTGGNLDTPTAPQLPAPSQTVNVNVDGSTVARATINRGAGSAAQDVRRNYRKP